MQKLSSAILCLGIFAAASVRAQHPDPIPDGIVFKTFHFTTHGKSPVCKITPNLQYEYTEDSDWTLDFRKTYMIHVDKISWSHQTKITKTGLLPESNGVWDTQIETITETLNTSIPFKDVPGSLRITHVPQFKGAAAYDRSIAMSGRPTIPIDTTTVDNYYKGGSQVNRPDPNPPKLPSTIWVHLNIDTLGTVDPLGADSSQWGGATWDFYIAGEDITGSINNVWNVYSDYLCRDYTTPKRKPWLKVSADWDLEPLRKR